MKIIEIKEYESPIYKNREKEIIDESEYKFEDQYNFLPEFMEEIYDGINANELKEANQKILHYSRIRKDLQYIASIKSRTCIVEYYYDKECNVVAYLLDRILSREKNLVLTAVAIYKKIECEVS